MRMPWDKSKVEQLDLVDDASAAPLERLNADVVAEGVEAQTGAPRRLRCRWTHSLPKASLCCCLSTASRRIPPTRGPSSRTRRSPSSLTTSLCAASFSRSLCAALAKTAATASSSARSAYVRQSGPDSSQSRSSSAQRPMTLYAQVAENQKRHGLTPLDLARFMRARVDAGESNAEIAKRMGIDLTSVAHHLALLTLPPELDEAFRSGRCTSPRTLYELAKLQKTAPERVKAIVAREGEITRSAVASLKKAASTAAQVGTQNGRIAPPDVSRWSGERSLCTPRIAPRPHDEARRPGHVRRVGGLASPTGSAR